MRIDKFKNTFTVVQSLKAHPLQSHRHCPDLQNLRLYGKVCLHQLLQEANFPLQVEFFNIP